MADFCNICSEKLFGNEVQPDIDVRSIVTKIERGEIYHVLCEGCAMVTIERDLETGEILITTHENDTYITYPYKEWENGSLSDRYI